MYICEYIYSTVQREALSSYAIYICKCKQTCSPFIEAFWYASQFHCESVSMHLTWSLNGCVMARRHGRLTVCLLYRVVVFSWLLIYIEQSLPIASKIKFSVVSHIAFNKLFFFLILILSLLLRFTLPQKCITMRQAWFSSFQFLSLQCNSIKFCCKVRFVLVVIINVIALFVIAWSLLLPI